MDSGARNEKPIEESMKSLKIDTASKKCETNLVNLRFEFRNFISSGPREASPFDATSCMSSTGSIKGSEVDRETTMGDQGMYYYGYCYPGYSGSIGEWDDQGYYMPAENFEMQPSAAQAENGSVLYYLPGYQPGYASYNPIIPGAFVGADGQYLVQQSYYPNPMIQQPPTSPGFAYGPDLVPACPWDSSLLFANGLQLHGVYGDTTIPASKSNLSSRSQTFISSKTSTSSKSSTSESKGSSLGLDVKSTTTVPKHSLKPVNKGAPPVFSKGYIPINKLPAYAQGKSGVFYPNSPMNIKESGRNWVGAEKARARTKLHELGDFDDFDLNEQNRGPRTNNNKNALDAGVNLVGSPGTGKNENDSTLITRIKKDMYNLPDFPTEYEHALFFVIKSYSEDDIHKSIKYNVWASTPNGNRRLDNAFQLAQEKKAEKGSKCPVFLFFSVNASGQFCGVAEMLDHVDFNKNMDFWQQDKWNGFFPVKWHVIKDVPNPQFRHILLENNENKPVTNSRDTQEVKFPQGIEILNIFKNYSSKTSILDDFDFYENRQKVMQHKRSKPPIPNFDLPSVSKPDDDLKSVSNPQSVEAVLLAVDVAE
ncbi:uncharacterized protein LOC109839988 isoform X2 [Asparagus officinalis]|uniref:uncharacterized protein LOC109839988 isoform X2 n=1 Tax=Asparagus officinalis TaxID=4686 RepID=UPI00098E5318|nr:uncharacterized protein LOC109839988 isoform X2 [Asparagus officinalis]